MSELLTRLVRADSRIERHMIAQQIGELLAAQTIERIESALDAMGLTRVTR